MWKNGANHLAKESSRFPLGFGILPHQLQYCAPSFRVFLVLPFKAADHLFRTTNPEILHVGQR